MPFGITDRRPTLEDAVRYLTQVGAIGRIDQLYTVYFTLEWDKGGVVPLRLRGGIDLQEAMERLRRAFPGSFSDDYDYTVNGWKTVLPAWGPDYESTGCFLCEYEETFLQFSVDRAPRPSQTLPGRQEIMDKLRAAEGQSWKNLDEASHRQALEQEADYLIRTGAAGRIDRQYTLTIRPEWDLRAEIVLTAGGAMTRTG